MEEHDLAGLSVAVFDDFTIVEQRTFGVRSNRTLEPIDAATAFSTASISKPATALLCLILDAEGAIDIDAPIADYLDRWQLPPSAQFPGGARVTWRQLLTHTAGTSQHGFADYYEGDAVPSLIDSLEGRIPRYDKPIEFLFAPGTDWQYSGGGYVIVQMALEDHIKRPLRDLAREKMFEPLGLENTTMAQPGETGFPANAAAVHDESGAVIRTGLPITPQVSASGMWSTPVDLAKFAIAIQRALAGEKIGPISPPIARTLTDIVSLEHVGGIGTPFFRGFGFGNTDWFRHDGSNTGVNSDLMGSMQGGYGMVLMGNGDDGNTGPVFALLRRGIIDGSGWSGRASVIEQQASPQWVNAIAGSYRGLLYDLGVEYRIGAADGELWIESEVFAQFLGRNRSPMRYLGGNDFAIDDYPNRLRFDLDAAGNVATVTLHRPGSAAAGFTRPASEVRILP
jgi:CubicO group peptidase (beta-lactamase class C family)